jgi:hypothetical protein
MPLDSTKARIAITGELSVGALAAAAPTGTASALTGFTGLGYVSEDGVTETRDRSTETIKAWQNGNSVRTVVTEGTLSYQLTLIETTKATVELFYGATATQSATEGNVVVNPTATGGQKSFVFDVIDGSELLRVYIPIGEVTEVGDRTYTNGEVAGFDVTITASAASALSGGAARVWMTALKT